MSLYDELAKAYAQPSRAFRDVSAALQIPEQGLEGYKSGLDYADSLRRRKLQQQTLSEALGGQPINEGVMNLTGETGAIQHPNLAIAAALAKKKDGSPWRIVSGMTTKDQKPVQENLSTGEVRPVDLSITPTGRGAGFQTTEWDTSSDSDKALGKAVYEGRIRPQDLSWRDKGIATKLANEYSRINNLPPSKSYTAEVAGKTASAFAVGKPGMNALSLNTALGHTQDAQDAYNGIANTDTRFLNKPLNILRAQTNDPNVVKLQTTINALSGELATVFKGSSGTDQEIAHWLNVLSQDLTPRQTNAVIPQIRSLLASRLGALDYQRSSGMSGRGEMPLLSPKSKDIIGTQDNLFGKIIVSNGQESYLIDPSAIPDARKEGFEQQ